ncbi:MAG: aldo/keto reductase [Calditrichaeota bacterium]|nr:MAG: aldo/keto reductase [Calditrichota bacterium]
MLKRKFGNTGLEVSVLGLGAAQIGNLKRTDKEAEEVLNFALDNGINLIDTARMYGASEDRIGKLISHRRDEFVLSTKVGYNIPGYEDWTYECVEAGIDNALKLLKTDRLDIVHFHSCSKETLQNGIIDALEKAVESGKVLIPAYSGENEDLEFAISTGKFKSLQTSVNVFDQRGISKYLPKAKEQGMGTIGKRPLGNVPWRFSTEPTNEYCHQYWLRMQKMNLDLGMDWRELTLRFAAFSEEVDTIISGTANVEHLKENIEIVNKGKLPQEIIAQIQKAFLENDINWVGQI